MISSEVQRTLVKSPPELWAELGDPAALARHLGALGEIHVTRTEPETMVEWEAGDTTGTVVIKPSGWGTKVTLTATRTLAPPADVPAAIDDAGAQATRTEPPAADAIAEPLSAAADEEAPGAAPFAEGPAEAPILDVDPAMPAWITLPTLVAIEPPEPPTRRGFFARLFSRRRHEAPAPGEQLRAASDEESRQEHERVPEPERVAEPERAAEPERVAEAGRVPEPLTPAGRGQAAQLAGILLEAGGEPPEEAVVQPVDGAAREVQDEEKPDLAGELKAAEEVAAEEVRAVLTAVLDRLGAAHHRPFSRA